LTGGKKCSGYYDAVIEVTSEDNRQSRKKDHAGCAMAVACKREAHAQGVIISRSVGYIIKYNKAMRFKIPESVAREVVSFDRGGGFTPGEYVMKAPTRHERLGFIRGSHGGGHGRTARKIRRQHRTEGIRAVLGSKL
jgi:hypothetical protein